MRENSRGFLQKHCTEKLGVRHVLADVTQVNQTEQGDIRSVTDQAGRRNRGRSVRRLHGICGAAARQDARRRRSRIAATCCFAMPRWRCRSLTRRRRRPWPRTPFRPRKRRDGSGTSVCRPGAVPVMCIPAGTAPTRRPTTPMRYLGAAAHASTPRKISIRGGHRETFWKNNCVAVGLPRVSRAARILRHRADRAVGKADRRADARQPRSHGHRRGALQRGDACIAGAASSIFSSCTMC